MLMCNLLIYAIYATQDKLIGKRETNKMEINVVLLWKNKEF